jgi:HD-GYP domain-containing protein (c-di-GMP phosphodiesterase class II)
MPDGSHGNAPEAHEQHFVRALGRLGDARRVTIAQPVYSSTGVKLLDAGAAVSSRTLERLVGHRLAQPLEQTIECETTLRAETLVAQARECANANPLVMRLVAALPQADALWLHFAAAPLPPAVRLRLTVARDSHPALYEHSLRAAVVALAIGMRAALPPRQLQLLGTAALLHDIGMLHVDPAQYHDDAPLDAAARRQLHAHPVTGMLVAQRDPALNPAVATAILQHHERLDGSGYPNGLRAEQIGRLARVLMLTEVVLAMAERPRDTPELQLSLILRMNHRSFDRALADVVLAALPRASDSAGGPTADEAPRLARLFRAWDEARGRSEGQPGHGFIDARVTRLRRWLLEAGIDPLAESSWLDDDPGARAELHALQREALWHLRQVGYDAISRWPSLAAADSPHGAAAWIRAVAGCEADAA